MSFTLKICRTFLYIGQDTNDTMFWMLNCCKKTSAISNFHYVFYRQKLITKAVSKGSPKTALIVPRNSAVTKPPGAQACIACLILLTMSE